MAATELDSRQRGRIEERGASLRVVVYAGQDPVTGRRAYLRETIKGTEKAAHKRAAQALNRLLARVADQRSPESAVTFGYAVDEWLRTSEIEDSTRDGYVNYIQRYIRPALGTISVRKLDAHALERFYTELRRCRTRCDRKPFIERHSTDNEHDYAAAKCTPHACKPLAASTIRQIHSVISGTLSAAERWGWIDTNTARVARRPRPKPPEPDPAHSGRSRPLSRRGFPHGRGLGHPRLARDDHRNAPQRTLRPALLPRQSRYRNHHRQPQLGQRQEKDTKTLQLPSGEGRFAAGQYGQDITVKCGGDR
jgi:hypothetical protein